MLILTEADRFGADKATLHHARTAAEAARILKHICLHYFQKPGDYHISSSQSKYLNSSW